MTCLIIQHLDRECYVVHWLSAAVSHEIYFSALLVPIQISPHITLDPRILHWTLFFLSVFCSSSNFPVLLFFLSTESLPSIPEKTPLRNGIEHLVFSMGNGTRVMSCMKMKDVCSVDLLGNKLASLVPDYSVASSLAGFP